jgi:glutathione peroxidase
MTHWTLTLLMAAFFAAAVSAARADDKSSALGFKMKTITGQDADLSQYKGKVVLIVNTASECGLTPQYEDLEALYEKYSDKGLVVLGFPCNQFGKQEPGSDADIAKFCSDNYKVKFPMFSKVDVNGEGATPLYKYLTSLDTKPQGKGKISWNFEKFLLNRNGEVVARFGPRTEPDAPEVVAMIEAQLAKK